LNNQKGLFFPKTNLPGSNQMAMDIMMLEKARKESDITFALRFYTWEGDWLSIGKNQKRLPKHWLELVKDRKIRIVRRPSGGSAVLHSGGMTYSLIWLNPPRKKLEAYYLASQWLIEGFSKLGVPLKFGVETTNTTEEGCFATSTPSDLVDSQGNKRIGSAQFWSKGNLLQHGEILLNPPSKLWLKLFKSKVPKPTTISCIPQEDLEQHLHESCCKFWSHVKWKNVEFTKIELDQISTNSTKYLLENN
jgi:lipoate-protein ligase A